MFAWWRACVEEETAGGKHCAMCLCGMLTQSIARDGGQPHTIRPTCVCVSIALTKKRNYFNIFCPLKVKFPSFPLPSLILSFFFFWCFLCTINTTTASER